jgi:CHASE2 domain-containing sensor protein/signal transduction histidine kinase
MSLRLRLTVEWILIGLAGTVLIIFALRSDLTSAFDNLFYDRLSSFHRPAADERILLVDIDQHSLNTIGRWPWKREVHARLMRQLQSAKPRSVTVDILLTEEARDDGDRALADAIGSGSAPVILPLHFDSPGDDGRAFNVVKPVSVLARSAAAIGHVNLDFDSDGKVRRTALCFDPEKSGQRWPHVMELVYRGRAARPSAAYRSAACGETLMIPYSGRASHREISYADVLEGNVPPGLIEGRDVIVGATAAGMGDSFPVPFAEGTLLAGSEIMANMLTAIRRNNFVRPLPGPIVLLLSLAPMWLMLIGFLRWLPRTALLASTALVLALLGGSAAALSAQIWFPPGVALLALAFVYPLWGWRRLQAMSDFMGSELEQLEREGETLPLKVPQAKAGDLVGRQSAALASAIDHMRDLRLFLKNTLSDLPDPMVATDINGRVTISSDLVEQRLGQSILGLSLKSVFDAAVIPENRAALNSYLAEFAAGNDVEAAEGQPRQIPFVRFQTTDGGTFVMRQSRIENVAGALQGYIYYFADITTLANAQLEREQVLQLLSHDMRAPQSAIIASLSGNVDAEARKRIEKNARLTIKLAQDFVDLARMEDSKFVGEEVLLADLVRDVSDNFWSLAKERDIRIDVTDDTGCAFVIGEADGLFRAFSNLIDNAIKFSPDHGVIAVTLSRIAGQRLNTIVVQIADHGPGIDAEIAPKLFARFASTADQTGRIKGTGLGLAYVKAVIKRHGGEIRAVARQPHGTCFIAELPEAADDAVSSPSI